MSEQIVGKDVYLHAMTSLQVCSALLTSCFFYGFNFRLTIINEMYNFAVASPTAGEVTGFALNIENTLECMFGLRSIT